MHSPVPSICMKAMQHGVVGSPGTPFLSYIKMVKTGHQLSCWMSPYQGQILFQKKRWPLPNSESAAPPGVVAVKIGPCHRRDFTEVAVRTRSSDSNSETFPYHHKLWHLLLGLPHVEFWWQQTLLHNFFAPSNRVSGTDYVGPSGGSRSNVEAHLPWENVGPKKRCRCGTWPSSGKLQVLRRHSTGTQQVYEDRWDPLLIPQRNTYG